MKYLVLTLALLAPLPALAGANESPIKGTGPFSVVRNGEPAGSDDCKVEATNQAKFGTPEWPSLYFSKFHSGTDYRTGNVTLVEPEARFQNGFGAMEHLQVYCRYNLRTKKVISVSRQ